MNINISKSARQEEAINKWLDNKGIGTFNWVTGMGKTVVSTKIIAKIVAKIETHIRNTQPKTKNDIGLLRKYVVASLKIAIVVPSTTLKEQWTSILEKQFPSYIDCFIINTMHSFSDPKYSENVYLVIYDEIHLYLDNNYFSLFSNIKAKFKLGLSGTLFKDNKFIKENCPIIDVITEQEAMDNNWISEHQQINYLVTLDDSENSIYRTESSFIAKYTPLFNFRNSSFFDTLKRCTTDLTLCDSISIFNNYRPEKRKRRLPQDFKADGTVKFEELSRDDVKTIAELLTWSMARRQQILFEARNKRWKMVEFLKTYPNRVYIIFVQFIKDVNSLIYYLKSHGIIAAPFHSQLEKIPLYKLPNGTLTTIKCSKAVVEKYKSGEKAGQPKTYGTPKIKEAILNDMRAGKYNVLISNTAGDTGVDIPNLDTSINLCYTGNPVQHHQRKGRVIRLTEDKKALVINFACQNTIEMKKLEAGQSMTNNKITVVKNLKELQTSIIDYF